MAGDVRGQVLAAATRLFSARGFDGTTIQAIADEVGVTKPAVLHHFPSKEVLHRAVLDAVLEHFQRTLPSLLFAATASEDRFDSVFGELRRFFAEDENRARLMIREALDRPESMRTILAGPVRPWLNAIAEYIRAGQAHGRHFADVDAEAYIFHMLLLVINAVAAAPLCGPALGVPSAEARPRSERELARLAKTSLFSPPRAGAKPRKRRSTKAKR